MERRQIVLAGCAETKSRRHQGNGAGPSAKKDPGARTRPGQGWEETTALVYDPCGGNAVGQFTECAARG
jgi:hypothetical protein